MESKNRYICTYGASSDNIPKKYIDAAYELGKKLGEKGWNGINGAGAAGIMKATTDGFVDANRLAMGIIPQFMVDNGWQYDRLTELVVTPDMHTRKEMMAKRCQCAIALPGGCGTLEELLEIITWRQLKLFNKPLIILNIDGYYSNLINMLDKCIDEGFMRESHKNLWFVANTVDEAVQYIDNFDETSSLQIESKY